jgi:hypothetical protein
MTELTATYVLPRKHAAAQRLIVTVLSLALGAACDSNRKDATVAEDAGPAADGGKEPNNVPAWEPYEPADEIAGHDLTYWAKQWVRWATAATDCDSDPAYDFDGSLCARYQDPESPVFFVQSGDPLDERTRCVVPQGKPILVPLHGFYVDNVGREVPSTEVELMAEATAWFRSMTDLRLRVDGRDIEDLERWSVAPTPSEYVLPPEPNVYTCSDIPGYTGEIPAVIGGAFVALRAPAPGKHTLDYGGAATTLDGVDLFSFVRTTFSVE